MSVINTFILTVVLSIVTGLLACLLGRKFGQTLLFTKKGGLKENTGLYGILNLIISVIKFVPYILILLILYLIIGGLVNLPALIAISIFLELLPMFTLSTLKALSKVSDDVINAAVAMGSEPEEIMNFFVFPEAKDEINRKTIRLLFYGVLCAVAAQCWFSLV